MSFWWPGGLVAWCTLPPNTWLPLPVQLQSNLPPGADQMAHHRIIRVDRVFGEEYLVVAEACLTQPLSPTLTHVVVLGFPSVNESIVIAMISSRLCFSYRNDLKYRNAARAYHSSSLQYWLRVKFVRDVPSVGVAFPLCQSWSPFNNIQLISF